MNLFTLTATYLSISSFDDFIGIGYREWFGITYELFSILATTYLLFNLGCAIVLKTFSRLEKRKLALYNYEVISML